MKHNSTFISGLTHPIGWLHANDEVLVDFAIAWWGALSVASLLIFVAAYSRAKNKPLFIGAWLRIIGYCAILCNTYLYMRGNDFMILRVDKVQINVAMIVTNGGIQILLIYLGNLHCVLAPTWDFAALFCGIVGTVLTSVSSFAAHVEQWPAWFISAGWYFPVMFIWLTQHRRSVARMNNDVAAWFLLWLLVRLAYAVLQLSGASFTVTGKIDETAELAVTFVLHVLTLVPMIYTSFSLKIPPKHAKSSVTELANGDRHEVAVVDADHAD